MRPVLELEWATLSANSRSGVSRGKSGDPAESPVGWTGRANQNPNPREPAAEFRR